MLSCHLIGVAMYFQLSVLPWLQRGIFWAFRPIFVIFLLLQWLSIAEVTLAILALGILAPGILILGILALGIIPPLIVRCLLLVALLVVFVVLLMRLSAVRMAHLGARTIEVCLCMVFLIVVGPYSGHTRRKAHAPPKSAEENVFSFTVVNPPSWSQMPGLTVPKFPGSEEQVIPTVDAALPDLAFCEYYEYPPNDQFLVNEGISPVAGYSSPRGNIVYSSYSNVPGTSTAVLDAFTCRNFNLAEDGTAESSYVQRELKLRNGIRMRPAPTVPATDFPANYHDGVTMTKRAVGIFSFSFNMTMLPSSFWALTAEFAEFKPLDVEVTLTPKFNSPWPASSTVRNIPITESTYTTAQQDQVPGYDTIIPEEGSLGGYHGLSGFKLKCWECRIPLQSMNLDTSQAGTSNVNFLPVNNLYWSANLNRYMLLGQTDTKMPQNMESILSHCPFVHPLDQPALRCKKGFYVQKPFQPFVPGFYASALPFQDMDNTSQQPILSNTGDFRPHPWVTIPGGRGMIPGWFAPSPSQVGKYQWPFFLNTPMCDFIVDTSDWTGSPYDTTQINENPGDYATRAMNPGVEWDVTYTFRCAFRGAPRSMTSDIAQC